MSGDDRRSAPEAIAHLRRVLERVIGEASLLPTERRILLGSLDRFSRALHAAGVIAPVPPGPWDGLHNGYGEP